MGGRLVILLIAAALGVLVAYSVAGTPPVSAQPTYTDPYGTARTLSKEEEIYRFRKWLERTKPSQFAQGNAPPGQTFTTPQQATANQRVLTTASRAKVGGLGPYLIRGGLAGVAAGIWIHNGVTLYEGLQGPNVVPLHLDAEFRQAEYALEGSGGTGGGAFRYYSGTGVLLGSGMVTAATYSYSSSTLKCTLTIEYTGTASSTNTPGYVGRMGMTRTGGTTSTAHCGGGFLGSTKTTNPSPIVHTNNQNMSDPKQTFRFYTADEDGPNAGIQRQFGPLITAGQGASWKNPVFDWGDTEMLAAPASGSYGVSPSESTDLYNDISDTTAAPTAPPETTPETVPDHFPQEWEEEFPDVGEPGPQDDPYGDPDGDQIPNKDDDDLDGDGLPNESDPEPYGPPEGFPEADPDQDGTPNKDDTDDDGDGIPDEDDPAPFTPTDPATLPEDHPYADPDQDGIPNTTDPDDDGDGTPDQDDPAPYDPTEDGDFDNDGQPDTTDPDDDNDGTPDQDDPAPKDPNIDGDLDDDGIPDPWDGDQDEDGVPDWEDVQPRTQGVPEKQPDQDEDGVPDWSDPWKGNRYAPAEPTRDTDTDTVPDYKDPEIDNPDVPMQPWQPGSPGEQPQNPGKPNMPPNPSNPNYPTNQNPPSNPADPTSPVDPTAPINPNQPGEPGEPGGPPPTSGGSCPIPRQSRFDVPELDVTDTFPFSLILFAWESITDIGEAREDVSPCIPLPFGTGQGEWCFSEVQTQVSLFRNIVWFLVGGIMMPIAFYMLIKGGSKTE